MLRLEQFKEDNEQNLGADLEDEMQVEPSRSFQIGSLEKSHEPLVPMTGRVNPQSVGVQVRRIWVF